jgi:hypothetical protein
MNLRQALTATAAAALFLGASAWARQSPSAQDPAQNPAQNSPSAGQYPVTPANSTSTENPSVSPSSAKAKPGNDKPKHLSGNLVDVSCMEKALVNSQSAPPTPATPNPGASAPQFADPGSTPGPAQHTGGGMPGGQSPTTSAPPGQPGATPTNPDMSPDQAAQMARAAKVDDAAKQCVPSSSTQAFGLAMSGGQVVKFDSDGNARAQQALKDVAVEPGKKVKAKVTGTMEDNITVKVASVEVKGKRGTASGSTPGAGL